MDDSPKLTARQQQILDLVKDAIARTGAPPTRAEIATELGFRSANAAEEHLQALARKGVIELVGGTSRGIRLKSDTLRALNEARLSGLNGVNGMGGMSGIMPGAMPWAQLNPLTLPLVGRVAAGNPILAVQHIEQSYTVEASMFERRPDFLLKVRGMSMQGAGILDGDLLAVQKASEARNGQIVVARLGDEVTVKRFQRTKTGVELLPENPDFKPIVVANGDLSFSLEGLAVGLIRNTPLM
jgi:repressor LexA